MTFPSLAIDVEAERIASRMLHAEARLLDVCQWEVWAELFTDDAIYWAPAWLDEYETTVDPQTQVSMIYHDTKAALLERIARIESRKSIAALPLPRTVHVVTNIEVTGSEAGKITCNSAFAVHVYDPRVDKEHTRFGRYEHHLAKTGAGWKIAVKKITIANSRIPTALDFYSV